MSKKEALIALWRLLAELYDDKEKAKRLVEQSGVNPAHISADGAAADYWWRILLEAHKRGKVEEIVKNASWEIEERASDLKQAYRIYADAPDTGDLLEAPTMMPGQGSGISSGISIGKIEATNVSMRDQYIFGRGEINMGNETKIDTGGGAVVGGSVHTGGGHFVGRDMTVQGDRGDGAEIAQALAPVLTAVQQSTVDAATQAAAMQEIEKLKAELAKGKDADDSRIAGILDGLANLVPGAVAAVVSTFGMPLLVGIAGPVTQFVLNQFKRK